MTQTDRVTGFISDTAIKAPVRAATTAAITLAGEQTVDGIALVTDDRVLVKDQASSVANGIYVVDTGTWSRAPDFDGVYDIVRGTTLFVVEGSANGSQYWRVATAGIITIGTTGLSFERALVNDSSTITFTQAGTGAVPTTAQARMRASVNVFDFMSAIEIADVQAFTYLVNVSAAVNAAYAAHDCIDCPKGGYRIGAQLTMSAQQLIRGSGKRSTIFKKFFNGDMFASFPNEAGFLDLYLDGNGATYTGRLLPINGTDARQYAHRCVIKDAESYCIEFTAIGAGSQCTFNDCEISRYDGLAAGKFSVKIPDTQQLSAVPRKFTNIETNGTLFIDFGGGNNTYADGCFSGGYRYTADTRAANITGGRIANQLTLAFDGHNNSLVGVDVTPLITVQPGADNNHLLNSYNNGVPVDSSGNNRNTITYIETPYTPAFTAGGAAFALGNGTLTGSQSRTGSKITFTANLTIGTTTTVGTGAYSISLPVAANNTFVQEIGVVHIDRGGTHYSGFMQIAGGANVTTAQLIRDTSGSITFNSPGVIAAGDTIRMSGTYQL